MQDGITPEPGLYEIECHQRDEVKGGTLIMTKQWQSSAIAQGENSRTPAETDILDPRSTNPVLSQRIGSVICTVLPLFRSCDV
jgi:hypothetical protein